MDYYETLRTFAITGRGHVIVTYSTTPDGSPKPPPKVGEIIKTIFGNMETVGVERRIGHAWEGVLLVRPHS